VLEASGLSPSGWASRLFDTVEFVSPDSLTCVEAIASCAEISMIGRKSEVGESGRPCYEYGSSASEFIRNGRIM
jgi:hypothetical protein